MRPASEDAYSSVFDSFKPVTPTQAGVHWMPAYAGMTSGISLHCCG